MKKETYTENKPVLTKQEKNKNLIKSIIGWIITIILCFGFAKVFTICVVGSVEVDGTSMENTLSDGDRAFTKGLFFKNSIKRFDIIIIKRESGVFSDEKLVKRVIALPGETIEYEDGVLYINDEIVEEPFINDTVKKLTSKIVKKTMGENEYYVLGDNRGASSDSRYFGSVKKSEIKGVGITRYLVCVETNKGECVKRKLIWPTSVK